MATLKEQAVQILQDVPEEKMLYVVDVLKWLNSVFENGNKNFLNNMPATALNVSSDAYAAWDGFKKYKGIIPYDIDEKAELAQARSKKYADIA